MRACVRTRAGGRRAGVDGWAGGVGVGVGVGWVRWVGWVGRVGRVGWWVSGWVAGGWVHHGWVGGWVGERVIERVCLHSYVGKYTCLLMLMQVHTAQEDVCHTHTSPSSTTMLCMS